MAEELCSGQDPVVNGGDTADVAACAEPTGTRDETIVLDLGTEPQLTPEQMTLLTALVRNTDVPAAANAAGISRATAYRWMATRGGSSFS